MENSEKTAAGNSEVQAMETSEVQVMETSEVQVMETSEVQAMEASEEKTIEDSEGILTEDSEDKSMDNSEKEGMENCENCETLVSNTTQNLNLLAVVASVEQPIQQIPNSESEGDDSAIRLNKDGVEAPPVNVPIPEEVLDEATGLLRRALLAVTKEKELEGGKSVISSIDGETMQIQSETTSITMAIAGGPHEEKDLGGVSDPPTGPESTTMMNIKGLKIAELLHKDQLDGFNSLSDTHIVCEDGHVPCHRYILMAASKFINELLITEDPSELSVIHIPDVKLHNVVQVLGILYCGKALYSKSDEREIYKIFRMLGISTDGLQFRNSKPEDGTILGRLRFYGTEEAEEEEFIPNIIEQELADAERSSPSLDNTSTTESLHKEVAQEGLVVENRGPKVSSRSQIDKAETAKFLSIKMEMPEDDDAVVETDYKIKCRYCDETFTSERTLSKHLSSLCGSHLVGKYSYSNKQCLGCRRRFPSFSLYGLINHVESCKRLQVAFSATASQFVNGTLPPINVKEEGAVNEEEVNEDECEVPLRKIAKRQDPPKSSRKKQKKGVKKRKNPARKSKMEASSSGSSSSAIPSIKIVDVSSLVDEPSNSEQESDKTGDPEVILIDDDSNDVVVEARPRDAAGTNGYHQNIEEEEDDCEYVVENYESFRDIASVPMNDLRLLLTSCPVCRKRYVKLKMASNCLRTHGLRRCWICLKLVAADGPGFHQHNKRYHIIPGTDNKVECSFCKKQFGYNIAINTHMGNYHFSRLLQTTTKDFGANAEPLTATQLKTLESLNRGVGGNDCEGYPKGQPADKLPEQSLDESNDSDVMDVDDDDSSIQEIPQQSSSSSLSSPAAATASHSGVVTRSPPAQQKQRAQQPNLGRVLLEIKEIDGVIYNVYGLINPASTEPKTKFSKVIAIRNTDVDSNLP